MLRCPTYNSNSLSSEPNPSHTYPYRLYTLFIIFIIAPTPYDELNEYFLSYPNKLEPTITYNRKIYTMWYHAQYPNYSPHTS